MVINSVNFLSPKPRTPSAKTFGVLLFGLASIVYALSSNADCLVAGELENAIVERVYDGDTLKLKDGRHVRVVGVNTPEVDHGKKKDGQPLGEESRAATEAFLAKDKAIKLGYDDERVDHYGRTLAHVYDAKGNSLAAHLLRMGLGFQISIPPNLGASDCLQTAEMEAKKKRTGVWRNDYWKAIPSSSLTVDDTGFKRIQGVVVNVRKAKSIWLELEGNLAIKITPSNLQRFSVEDWASWQGKRIEARGWIVLRDKKLNASSGKPKSTKEQQDKPLLLPVYTPIALQLID